MEQNMKKNILLASIAVAALVGCASSKPAEKPADATPAADAAKPADAAAAPADAAAKPAEGSCGGEKKPEGSCGAAKPK
jgi:hypothetical protein